MTTKTILTINIIMLLVLTGSLIMVPNIIKVSAADNRCVSERSDSGDVGRQCLSKDMPDSQEIMKEQKQICREVADKCSSSQTGYGNLPKLE